MFRDRDYLITKEGIIFRVYGYTHPPNKAVCDVEYAPKSIFTSEDPRSIRFTCQDDGIPGMNVHYKFMFDGGLRFIKEKYPEYQVYYKPLNNELVGLDENQVYKKIEPKNKLKELHETAAKDSLIRTMNLILKLIVENSSLKISNFGVFGSLCLDFHHVKFSDVDLIIYGKKELIELRNTLSDLYKNTELRFYNEFDLIDLNSFHKSSWKFKNYALKEYVENERKKLIYSVIDSPFSKRHVKIEFEPVKKFSEIINDYEEILSIEGQGWIELKAIILDDSDAFYLQSIYLIEVLEISQGKNVPVYRICNYLEEFRGIVKKDDVVLVKGNLEKVTCKNQEYYQVTLSYGMVKHSEQVLLPFTSD